MLLGTVGLLVGEDINGESLSPKIQNRGQVEEYPPRDPSSLSVDDWAEILNSTGLGEANEALGRDIRTRAREDAVEQLRNFQRDLLEISRLTLGATGKSQESVRDKHYAAEVVWDGVGWAERDERALSICSTRPGTDQPRTESKVSRTNQQEPRAGAHPVAPT